jgi:predicted amidohydrolase
VAVIGCQGQIVDIRRKIDIIPGNYEGWASPGTPASLSVDGHRVGYYICADAVNPDMTDACIADNGEIILSPAAGYPYPSMGPDAYRENVSRVSGVPLVIANTVGKTGTTDFTRAESWLYLNGKNIYTVQVSVPAIAYVDWNSGRVRSSRQE